MYGRLNDTWEDCGRLIEIELNDKGEGCGIVNEADVTWEYSDFINIEISAQLDECE